MRSHSLQTPEKKAPMVAAVIVATVCATALLMVLIFGGLYITELKGRNEPSTAPDATGAKQEGGFDVSVMGYI